MMKTTTMKTSLLPVSSSSSSSLLPVSSSSSSSLLPVSSSSSCNANKVDTCNADLIGSSASNIIGCLPCSHEYLTASYFDNHDRLLDSDFHGFVTQNICSNDLCTEMAGNVSLLGLSEMKRHLIGKGSHRNLVSTMRFGMQLDESNALHDHICEMTIIERLPIGVFADPFELQHLVERKVFLSASVVGDTNLELPSALSSRSIVEIHMNIGCGTVVQLPLHARYPPLDTSGYAQVAIGKPDLFLRCRPKYLQNETCSWAISNLGFETNSVMWQIPCGDEALRGLVSAVSFGSALLCSLAIGFSAIYFSKNSGVEG